jgi:hypothetical protein
MVEPLNHYEIANLREVYGVGPRLAVFSEGHGDRFQIETSRAAAGIVSSQIAELIETASPLDAVLPPLSN